LGLCHLIIGEIKQSKFYENETKFGTDPAVVVCLRLSTTKPRHFTDVQHAPACKKSCQCRLSLPQQH